MARFHGPGLLRLQLDGVASALVLMAAAALLIPACAQPRAAADPPCPEEGCDDGEPCTLDLCVEGRCTSTPLPEGTDCADALACNGLERCDAAGHCRAGEAPTCEPDSACSTARCVEPSGSCVSEPVAGCCVNDEDCADDDPCSEDRCSPETQTCSHSAIPGCCRADGECGDDDPCTLGRCEPATHRCAQQRIVGCCGADGDCADDDVCTTERCDLETHRCAVEEIAECCTADADCSAADACTRAACDPVEHRCTAEEIPGCCRGDEDCEDPDPCTVGTCDPETRRCQQLLTEGCCRQDGDCPGGGACETPRCSPETHTCGLAALVDCCEEDGDCPAGGGCLADLKRCGAAAAPGAVALNEVMVHPQRNVGLRGQWVELLGRSEEPLLLNGWSLRVGGQTHRLTAALPVELGAGGYALVAAEPAAEDAGERTLHFVSAGLSLPDEGLLELLDARGEVVDALRWDRHSGVPVAASWASSAEHGGALGDDPRWHWCPGATPWQEGADAGTPGADNPPCPPIQDVDGDGWPGPLDCNDRDPAFQHDDVDGDGATSCEGDCDDQDAALGPQDRDHDGFSTCDGDCDDGDANRRPEGGERCGNAVDDDCDGLVDIGPGCPLPLRIQEVVYDLGERDGSGVFIELVGPAGLAVDGAVLRHFSSEGEARGRLALDGLRVGADGYLLLAHSEARADLARLADLRHPFVDLLDSDASLVLEAGGAVSDALAWGAPAVHHGEGRPAVDVQPTHALSRRRGAPDTDDNARDFVEAAPSPRGELVAVDGLRLLDAAQPVVLDQGARGGPLAALLETPGASAPGPAPGLSVELGLGPQGTLPWQDARWTFVAAQHLGDEATGERWGQWVQADEPGTWAWCLRASLDGVYWSYGDGGLGSADGYDPAQAGLLQVGSCDDQVDRDGDGCPCALDCDDRDPARDSLDRDGDGASSCAGDCDDDDPTLHPFDRDQDGFSPCQGDCDDGDRGAWPGGAPVCGDEVDNDCDGLVDGDDVGEGGECPPAVPLLINELLYDQVGLDGSEVFVELYSSQPGARLQGHSLLVYDATGLLRRSVDLSDVTVPESGYVLLVHPNAAPELRARAQVVDSAADLFNDAASLVLRRGELVVDALAYGSVDPSRGEGRPAPDVVAGHSLGRDADHRDSDDNAADFEDLALPTPGTGALLGEVGYAALQWPLAAVDLLEAGPSPLLFGRVYVAGVTEGQGQGPDISAQLCWGPEGSEPDLAQGWTCADATYNGDLLTELGELNDDEYRGLIPVVPCGRWIAAYRFRYRAGPWVWADRAPEGSLDGFSPAAALPIAACACDAAVDRDQDGAACDQDCNDADPALNLADLDGDGSSTCAGDCDDHDPALHALDRDGDGFSPCAGDCDDEEAAARPAGDLVCGDGVDNDCDGATDDLGGECPLELTLLINEVYYDEPSGDGPSVFIELWGQPAGAPLRGVRLLRYTGDGLLEREVELGAGRLGEDGFFLIAHPSANAATLALADLLDPVADGVNTRQSLRLLRNGEVLDALAWGAAEPSFGEGRPAPDVAAGRSLSRDGRHGDTGDNLADFRDAAPTPRRDLEVFEVTAAAILAPLDPVTLRLGEDTPVLRARVLVPGRSEGPGAALGLVAELGWGPRASEPASAAGWTWQAASYAGELDDADLVEGVLRPEAAGSWDFAFRFSQDQAPWVYADAAPAGSLDGYQAAAAGKLEVLPALRDEDGDGSLEDVDCDDHDPALNRADFDQDGATSCDGDCDDLDPARNLADSDQDGATSCDGDCDDLDPALNLRDADGDGATSCGGDCDDQDPALNLRDADGDGATSCGGDCDDADPALNLLDADGDGATSCGGDCDDQDPTLNLLDADGDGATSCAGDCDDADPALNLADADGDGQDTCSGDCDDHEAGVSLGQVELCRNERDDDCDGAVDALDPDCGPPPFVRIAEVLYDDPGEDGEQVFVELHGDPDLALDGLRLVALDPAGVALDTLLLDGLRTDASGYLLLAHPAAVPELAARAHGQSTFVDLPDAAGSLVLWLGGLRLDALSWGAVAEPLEGQAAPNVEPGQSLARDAEFHDTDDNAADFAAAQPSPLAPRSALRVGWAAFQWPLTALRVEQGDPVELLFGRAYVGDCTPAAGACPELWAQLGWAPQGSPPDGGAWSWVPAVYNSDLGNDDEVRGQLPALEPGLWDLAFRFSLNGLTWLWADLPPAGSDDGWSSDTTLRLEVVASQGGAPLLISEIVYDDPGTDGEDVFIELHGLAGASLDGLELVSYERAGAERGRLALDGYSLGEDGFFVVAHTLVAGELAGLADVRHAIADLANTGGALRLLRGAEAVDALAWRDQVAALGLGEGEPAAAVVAGHSLCRQDLSQETGDNLSDFADCAVPGPRAP